MVEWARLPLFLIKWIIWWLGEVWTGHKSCWYKWGQEEKCEFLLLKWSLLNSQIEKSHHRWVTVHAYFSHCGNTGYIGKNWHLFLFFHLWKIYYKNILCHKKDYIWYQRENYATERLRLQAMCYARICELKERRFWSRDRNESWLLRAFV